MLNLSFFNITPNIIQNSFIYPQSDQMTDGFYYIIIFALKKNFPLVFHMNEVKHSLCEGWKKNRRYRTRDENVPRSQSS